MGSDGRLVLLPALRAARAADGAPMVTRKFRDGVLRYLEDWTGPVRVLIEPSDTPSENLDNIPIRPSELPFELEVMSFDAPELGDRLAGAEVALGTHSYRQNHLAEVCTQRGVACVYGTEYTLRTRVQIVRSNTDNKLLRARRYAWEWNQERQQRIAMMQTAGVQCNGTPTFDAYRGLCRNTMLFFDNRITQDMLVSEDTLSRRLATLEEDKPIRLAFSGRLDPMKGTNYLPHIAAELRNQGVPFEMTICGGGTLEDSMRAEIKRLGLDEQVKMAGVLDFESELMPLIQNSVDLFVCPHVQGDPSCTYVETLACGVPIVGFDNEAFTGVTKLVDAGWTAPIGDTKAIADRIAMLTANRNKLVHAAHRGRGFAAEHTFEQTFRARVEHLRRCRA